MNRIPNIGRNVRAFRKLHNWSLKDLAQKSGLDSGTLSRLERGEGGYSAESVEKLCNAFSISEGTLFSDENPTDNRMLEFRRIPLLDESHIPAYVIDHEIIEVKEYLRYIAVDKTLSFNSFAYSPDIAALKPTFDEGDVVVIDPSIKPQPGDFVVAVVGKSAVIFSRYRVTSEKEDGTETFELIPLNDFYPVVTSLQPGVRLVGTMVEHRRYRKRK
jgi:transcriptional regulator with XRE-family HTH domain